MTKQIKTWPAGLKFGRNDRIRTTYYYSSCGMIKRYVPIPSVQRPGEIMEWYLVKFDDGTAGTIHASMMNRANDAR